MGEQQNRTPLSEQVAFWDEKTADAIRAAVYAERQREIAHLALSGQMELDYGETISTNDIMSA
jgi:hypothetical protein